MSLLEFSEDKYVKTFDDDEEIRLGSFQTAETGWLGTIRANIFVDGVFDIVGNETLKMKIYSDSGISNLYAESNEIALSQLDIDAAQPAKTAFLGYIKFDFNQEHINKNFTYYPTVTISNYTRTASFYVGLLYDFPDPLLDNGATKFFNHPIAMQIFTYRDRP